MRSQSTPWRRDLLIAVAAFAVLVVTAAGPNPCVDVVAATLGSLQLVLTGAPVFPSLDAVPFERDLTDRLFWATTPSGDVAVARSPGVIAAGVPAYFVRDVLTGNESFSLLPGGITAAVLVAVGAFFLLRTLDGLVTRRVQLLAAGTFVFATPVWSVAADNMWTHTVTVPALLGLAWAARSERWWLVGVFGGIALWGRTHTALVVAIVGVAVAVARRQPAVAVKTAVPSLSALGLASVWSQWIYGSWNPAGAYFTPVGYVRRASGYEPEEVLATLAGLVVSADRGLLVWTPILLLLAPAVARGWRDTPDWSRAMALGGVAYLLVQSFLNPFHGGDAFWGYRLGLETLTCLLPVYALTAHHAGRLARPLLGPVIALQCLAIGFGALSEIHLVPFYDTWHENSFVMALLEAPVLWVIVAIVLAVGVLAGRSWRRSGPSAAEMPTEISATA